MKQIRKKRGLAMLMTLVLLASLLAGCGGSSNGQTQQTQPQVGGQPQVDATVGTNDAIPEEARYGGVLDIVYSAMDDHVDINAPGASAGTLFWARYVYESALVCGLDGTLYPLVCEYDVAEDYSWLKLWTREGVTFHDGTDVTIEDVIASYKRNTKRDIFENVVDTKIEGDTVTFTFNENGCVNFMYWLAYPTADYGVMPKWICEQFDPSEGNIITDPKYVIGTGCYKVVPDGFISQEVMPLERYDGYVACEEGGDGNGQAAPRRAYMDKINCHVNKDANNRLMHLINGDYDACVVDQNTFESSLEGMGFQMYYDPSGKTMADNNTIAFNMREDSTSILAKDANLRKAILAAIDMPAASYARYSSWYYDIHSPIYIDGYTTAPFDNADYCGTANIELAKEYLAKSNYNGETIILRRPATAGSETCLQIQQDCEAAGIHIEIEPVEVSAYSADFRDGTSGWDMYNLYGQGVSTWPGLMPTNAYSAWKNNEEANELREKLFSYMTGTEESIAYWEEYAQLMAEEAPCFVICKSKGDRFVQAPGLNPNYTGYAVYYNAYWDEPSAHMD